MYADLILCIFLSIKYNVFLEKESRLHYQFTSLYNYHSHWGLCLYIFYPDISVLLNNIYVGIESDLLVDWKREMEIIIFVCFKQVLKEVGTLLNLPCSLHKLAFLLSLFSECYIHGSVCLVPEIVGLFIRYSFYVLLLLRESCKNEV